jgi:Methylase involved in ubiquinone/menaquinone biosynthesis
MASNQEIIIKRYGDGSREEGRASGERAEYDMEYKYTKRILDRYIKRDAAVLEIGCGTGYYGMYLADKCKDYTGIDIVPANIALLSKKIAERKLENAHAMVADATNLKEFADGSFDVVLALGPIYHLPPKEQETVFKESKRVCKQNGVVMFAYITKLGIYLYHCLKAPEKYPNAQKNQSLLREGIDDTRDQVYWFHMPEEMEALAQEHGLAVVDNLGVDFTFIQQNAGEKAAREEVFDRMCASPFCTAFANHAVMVCINRTL